MFQKFQDENLNFPEDQLLNKLDSKGIKLISCSINFKEKSPTSTKDPYWLIRSRCYLLNMPIYGERTKLQQNFESFLFFSSSNHIDNYIPKNYDCIVNSNIDLFEKRFDKRLDEKQYFCSFGEKKLDSLLPKYKRTLGPIYIFIPELKLMKRNLTYPEIYESLSILADKQMLFVNRFKSSENNLLTGIIYFPYTPKMIEHVNCPSNFIQNLASYLKLSCNYDCFESEKMNILKQKLLDLYYLCEDSEELHPINDCQSPYLECEEIASSLCENKLCKQCCESAASKEFCFIHDDEFNYYRKKLQEILEFENSRNFDRNKTIRITINQRINKHQLQQMFNNYLIDWDANEYFFKKEVGKIEYVYAKCASNEEAIRFYNDKYNILRRYSNYDLNIHPLLDPIENLIPFLKKEILKNKNLNAFEIYNFGLIIFPPSNLILDIDVFEKKFGKKKERIDLIGEYIEDTIGLNKTDYCVVNCINSITKEKNYDYYFIGFKSQELKEKFYFMQTNLNYVIFHDLTHINILPFFRKLNYLNLCLNCKNDKHSKCLFGLCENCCILIKENTVKKIFIKEFKASGFECGHKFEIEMNTNSSILSEYEMKKSSQNFKDYKDTNNSQGSKGLSLRTKAVSDCKENRKIFCQICNKQLINQVLICPNYLCLNCCLRLSKANKICVIHSNLSKNQIKTFDFFNNHSIDYNRKDKSHDRIDSNNKAIKQMRDSKEKSSNKDLKIFKEFLLLYQNRLSRIKFKIIGSIKNSDFSWFRPIDDREITRSMIDINKELLTVMDNPIFFRENPLKISDKMYKIFTFQNEKFIEKNYDEYQTIEGFDLNGEYFLECNFENEFQDRFCKDFDDKFNLNKFENNDSKSKNDLDKKFDQAAVSKKMYKKEDKQIKINEFSIEKNVYLKASSNTFQNHHIKYIENNFKEQDFSKEGFHLILMGLDNEMHYPKDLIDLIYNDLRFLNIEINGSDIHLLDDVSLLSIFLKYSKLNIPLIERKKGHPKIIMGDLLKEFIRNYKLNESNKN